MTLPPERMDRIEAGGIAMSWLIDMLSDDVGRTVIDRTGFTERFNLLLDFVPRGSARFRPLPTISRQRRRIFNGLFDESISRPILKFSQRHDPRQGRC